MISQYLSIQMHRASINHSVWLVYLSCMWFESLEPFQLIGLFRFIRWFVLAFVCLFIFIRIFFALSDQHRTVTCTETPTLSLTTDSFRWFIESFTWPQDSLIQSLIQLMKEQRILVRIKNDSLTQTLIRKQHVWALHRINRIHWLKHWIS